MWVVSPTQINERNMNDKMNHLEAYEEYKAAQFRVDAAQRELNKAIADMQHAESVWHAAVVGLGSE